ncbi:MAG: radical SAM protein [Betaproteobacteria bacterium]|nr:radical SAM protein [Betaproteobacteria bacterium]
MTQEIQLAKPGQYRHAVSSMCPECLQSIPGEVVATRGGVVMRKACPQHGDFECAVSSDLAAYERMRRSPRIVQSPAQPAVPEAKGCPDDCGLCPAHDQHTCLAIVEITSRCNLPCPVCLADSTTQGRDLTVAQVVSALEKLRRAEGAATPLQFAGGEPTLHSDLLEIVRAASRLGYRKLEIDSNGLLLASRPSLANDLRQAGLTGVYLQMDTVDPGASTYIRGRDLLSHKLRAIDHCKSAGLQVVLSVTVVPGVNDDRLWDMIRFAAARRLTGVNFQSVVLSGRYPPALAKSGERFTAGHFMRAIERQSEGRLRAGDLMPMSCPDPRCGLFAYVVVKRDGELVPINRLLGEDALRRHVADFSDWETLLGQIGCSASGCSCNSSDADPRAKLADLLEGAECFSIGFHGMMDAYSFDLERARRCCVHKLTSEGKLMPFCLYNMKYRPQEVNEEKMGSE